MDRVGRYRIVGEIGRGAMGVVYHAIDPAIGRSVAIKTIRFRDIDDDAARERLRERLFREARSAGVLSHPNIVTIYDMDEVDGLAYIAMAYVNGPTLEKILASDKPLSGATMLRILRQTALALDYAHSKGIVHRDVKPANVMTDEDGIVKVTDFGIAKITSGAQASGSGKIVGTLSYMSPEQVQGLEVDGRSDQFSLAVIAYEILTGERPFTGEHLSSVIFRIVSGEPKPAQEINTTLTPQIDEVLRKGLAKNREDRFQNCSVFVGALEMACAESRGWKTISDTAKLGAAASVGDAVPTAEPGAGPPRRAWRVAPVLLGVGAVVAATGVLAWRSSEFPAAPNLAAMSGPATATLSGSATATLSGPALSPGAGSAPPSASVPPAAEESISRPGADTDDPSDGAPPPAAPDQTQLRLHDATSGPANSSALARERDPRMAAKPAARPSPLAPLVQPANDSGIRQTVHIPEAAAQDIWVATNPPGAKAVIDGDASHGCATPCMLQAAPGVHHLIILQNGFLPEYREIHVGAEPQDLPEITLRKPFGTLMLTSNPPGASIYINGQPVPQVTPAQLSLPPGTYDVRVEKDGRSEAETVQLHQGPLYLRLPLDR